MIPGGYSASNSEATSQTARNQSEVKSGASGGSRGIVNNIAFPGATLEADTGTGGAPIPPWMWGALGVAVAVAGYFAMRKR